MNDEENHAGRDPRLDEAASRTREPSDIEVIDLGSASKRTRGSYSGFIVETSAFPLRDF